VNQGPYILKQADNLSSTFARMTQLPAHRLAGHAANLDFWKQELDRCIKALATYPQRMRRMKEATNNYLKTRPVVEPFVPMEMDHIPGLKPDTRTTAAVRDSDLETAKRELLASASRFIGAVFREQLIPEDPDR
jgi:hypothetical protein